MRTAATILIAMLVAAPPVLARDDDDADEDAALAAVVKKADITLEQGFSASAREGTPISGKFEFETDGAQLSVYTARGDGYSEVIVDHISGAITKVVSITEGKDLVEARQQAEAMRGAEGSLADAALSALKTHQGYRTVSATPGRKDGAVLVKVVLTNGTEWKTVYEPLKGSSR